MNPLKTNFESAQDHVCYLEALKLSCLKNIELANQELEHEKASSAQSNSSNKSWFEFISPKKNNTEDAKKLQAYKSNVCRQMMICKKLNTLSASVNIA